MYSTDFALNVAPISLLPHPPTLVAYPSGCCPNQNQAVAGLQADLAKLATSSAVGVEQELNTMTARRKELSSKNVNYHD